MTYSNEAAYLIIAIVNGPAYLFGDSGADDVGRCADERSVATEAGAERQRPDQRLDGNLQTVQKKF